MLDTGFQLLFAYPEIHVAIWSIIPFLSRTKIHAKHFLCAQIGPRCITSKSALHLTLTPPKQGDKNMKPGIHACTRGKIYVKVKVFIQ